eukprot:1159743-Pelagomonas_calceolata.AAC.3
MTLCSKPRAHLVLEHRQPTTHLVLKGGTQISKLRAHLVLEGGHLVAVFQQLYDDCVPKAKSAAGHIFTTKCAQEPA